jgi:hypothetical protein
MKSQQPKVGEFVRVKLRRSIRPLEFRSFTCEGLVTSTLFDTNFEVSYIEDEKPISHWFNLNDISSLEVL